MYERMLNKQCKPTFAELAAYCGENQERFSSLNSWLSETFGTAAQVVFPYGNHYGWGVAHRLRQKLVCNVFAEHGAFTVMVRLSDKQFAAVYAQVCPYTQEQIDNKYPCGGGGWIHYRVTCAEHVADIQKLITVKCPK